MLSISKDIPVSIQRCILSVKYTDVFIGKIEVLANSSKLFCWFCIT